MAAAVASPSVLKQDVQKLRRLVHFLQPLHESYIIDPTLATEAKYQDFTFINHVTPSNDEIRNSSFRVVSCPEPIKRFRRALWTGHELRVAVSDNELSLRRQSGIEENLDRQDGIDAVNAEDMNASVWKTTRLEAGPFRSTGSLPYNILLEGFVAFTIKDKGKKNVLAKGTTVFVVTDAPGVAGNYEERWHFVQAWYANTLPEDQQFVILATTPTTAITTRAELAKATTSLGAEHLLLMYNRDVRWYEWYDDLTRQLNIARVYRTPRVVRAKLGPDSSERGFHLANLDNNEKKPSRTWWALGNATMDEVAQKNKDNTEWLVALTSQPDPDQSRTSTEPVEPVFYVIGEKDVIPQQQQQSSTSYSITALRGTEIKTVEALNRAYSGLWTNWKATLATLVRSSEQFPVADRFHVVPHNDIDKDTKDVISTKAIALGPLADHITAAMARVYASNQLSFSFRTDGRAPTAIRFKLHVSSTSKTLFNTRVKDACRLVTQRNYQISIVRVLSNYGQSMTTCDVALVYTLPSGVSELNTPDDNGFLKWDMDHTTSPIPYCAVYEAQPTGTGNTYWRPHDFILEPSSCLPAYDLRTRIVLAANENELPKVVPRDQYDAEQTWSTAIDWNTPTSASGVVNADDDDDAITEPDVEVYEHTGPSVVPSVKLEAVHDRANALLPEEEKEERDSEAEESDRQQEPAVIENRHAVTGPLPVPENKHDDDEDEVVEPPTANQQQSIQEQERERERRDREKAEKERYGQAAGVQEDPADNERVQRELNSSASVTALSSVPEEEFQEDDAVVVRALAKPTAKRREQQRKEELREMKEAEKRTREELRAVQQAQRRNEQEMLAVNERKKRAGTPDAWSSVADVAELLFLLQPFIVHTS